MDARHSVAGQLLASSVMLLSGLQDLGLRVWIGAGFGFLMALAFGMCALIDGLRAGLWYAVATCALVLCSETGLMLRWLAKKR